MVTPYADPGSALSRGIESGTSLALAFYSAKEQSRKRDWEQGLEGVKLGLEIAKSDMPDEYKMNAWNKSVVPFMNKYFSGVGATPVPIEAFQKKPMKELISKLDDLSGNENLSSWEILEGGVKHYSNFVAAGNKESEAVKIRLDLMKSTAEREAKISDAATMNDPVGDFVTREFLKRDLNYKDDEIEQLFASGKIPKSGLTRAQISALKKGGTTVSFGGGEQSNADSFSEKKGF